MLLSRHTRRREFITLLGGAAAAWPLAASAQQAERVRRIGVLMSIENDSDGKAQLSGFTQGLAEIGWTDGRNHRPRHGFARRRPTLRLSGAPIV
jgi:putative ABC transport system substrate-binding protein